MLAATWLLPLSPVVITHFVYVERNGEVVMDNRGGHGGSDEEEDDIQLNFRLVYDFATTPAR